MPNNDSNKQPLFKFEKGEQTNFGVIIPFAVVLFVCVALYITGVLVANPILTNIALVLAIVGVFVGLLVYKSFSESKQLDGEELEAELRQYEADVRNTFIGYQVEFSEDDIKAAVDKRREELMVEHTNIKIENPLEMASLVGKTMKEEYSESRSLRKEYKEAKKNRRAAKKKMKNKEGE